MTTAKKELVLYNEMVLAISRCVEIDEADRIRDKASKIEAYAKIRDDRETQTKFTELRLRATQRIGELSRELEKATNQYARLNDETGTKTEQLERAGIDRSTANRYEQLSGPREEQAQRIVASATNAYFANVPKDKTPTFTGLKSAVQTALETTYGKPPKHKKPPELSDEDRAEMKWNALMMDLMEVDPELAAAGEHKEFAQERFDEATQGIEKIQRYQRKLTELYGTI